VPVRPSQPSGAKPGTRPTDSKVAAVRTAPQAGGAATATATAVRPEAKAKAPSPLDPKQIYYVESDVDPTALIARHAGVDDGWLHWDDTNRDRLRHALSVEVLEDGVAVMTENNVRYVFRPLTLELYDTYVKAKVELSPSFPTTEDLVEFYRKTVF
jgi:hypothetical protein